MKILKVFGIVVGIHLFALILIFANPGCSSTTKPPPAPSQTVAQEPAAPMITLPAAAPAPSPAAPIGFNPDAPATYASTSEPSVRYVPTRPNTPAASAVVAQPVENVTPATTYIVKSGDSLWTLQKRFHVDYRAIAAANNLKTGAVLREGQKLIIPARASTTASSAVQPQKELANPAVERAPMAKPAGKEFKYTVQPGETLGAIAQKFDVRTRDLIVRNNIGDPQKIRAGMELTIPGWQSPAAKAASVASEPAPTQSATAATSTQIPSIQLEPEAPAQSPTNNVPVIRIDDNPLTPEPAPKS